MNRKIRTLALISALLIFTLALSSCGSVASMAKPTSTGTPVAVTASVSATTDGVTVTVNGQTDLREGTFARLSLTSDQGKVLVKQAVQVPSDGKVTATFNIASDWSDRVYAYFVATPKADGEQSDEIYELYGKSFENMTGKDVIWTHEYACLSVQSAALKVREQPVEG